MHTPDAVEPLFDRSPDDPLYIGYNGHVSVGDVERRVLKLGSRLPPSRYILNLCVERHHFLVAFSAIVSSGRVNLLPPNSQSDTLAELVERYGDVGIVHDSTPTGAMPRCDIVDVRDAANEQATDTNPTEHRRPAARRDALAAISFTSGSTGVPRANEKTWGMLIDGTDINLAAVMNNRAQNGLSMLATVPPQHMYGLEMSVLMPMRARITVHVGQPLYPADVVATLEQMPEPRALVTTPAHLRSLLDSQQTLPSAECLFSATAPLEAATAARAESAFNGTLTEIYGCSEVGSIARRQTAREEDWRVFAGLNLVETTNIESGRGEVRIVASHLVEAAELQDSIRLTSPGSFLLHGRRDDLINIAGKRGSLAEVNRRLLAIPGVLDGVAFQPDDGRLAALVVAPGLDRSLIVAALRRVIDPVFVPRPILFVDRLPRQGSSKLRRADLLAALQAYRVGDAAASGTASYEA